jgi:GNAT superfamily N-acetyltransferase
MSGADTFTIGTLGIDRADILVEARRHMYEDMGESCGPSLDAADETFAVWLAEHLADGQVIGYAAWAPGGHWLGALTAHVQAVPPSMGNPSGVQHYLLGLWVRPQARRLGVATALVSAAVERARADGVGAVSLMASDTGRLVYERMGFTSAPAMRKFFEPLP